MHQIRVQLASRGWPILGDEQYGSTRRLLDTPLDDPLSARAGYIQADPRAEPIALHARSLTFQHPVRYDSLTVTAPLPGYWPLLPQ